MKVITYYPIILVAVILTVFTSCNKDASSTKTATSTTTSTATTASTGTISLGTLASTSTGTTTDSLYLVNCFSKNSKKDTVAFSALPTAIGTYLTANYSGYTFKKAYKITDSLSVVTGYIVVIKYNGSLVGLKFTATGTFVATLEQRGAGDLSGQGWHAGGPFSNRDGKFRDTIALSAIPTVVKTYFTTTYPTDTLLHVWVTRDTTYILISKNAGLYATAITKTGTLVKRISLQKPAGIFASVLQANLSSAVLTYLTSTYPGYVFNKAYSKTLNSVVQGYDVFITSNSTNYDVKFDASGTFIKAITLH
jgi:hypothetical protein